VGIRVNFLIIFSKIGTLKNGNRKRNWLLNFVTFKKNLPSSSEPEPTELELHLVVTPISPKWCGSVLRAILIDIYRENDTNKKFWGYNTEFYCTVFIRAGHSLLFPLFAIRSSATSTPLFAIATPLLFRKLQYATRYSLSLLLFHQCCGLHQF
jgi:hypothetical protein